VYLKTSIRSGFLMRERMMGADSVCRGKLADPYSIYPMAQLRPHCYQPIAALRSAIKVSFPMVAGTTREAV
jgi:hypothetical protein